MPRSSRTGTPLEIDQEIEKTARKLRKQAKLQTKLASSSTSTFSPPVTNIWQDVLLSNKDSTIQQMDHDTRFNAIDIRFISLQVDLNLMRTEHSDQRSMLRLMYAHQREMRRFIASLRNLFLKQPEFPPAPPPE
ncbi:hypothetical protein E3N88_46027 [Mikania micrantha]|uniref:Uncharacterized protein n=1 Tax=Mikania micrantha TaxID=192012 RepID=A0A5N6L7K9_9ASTR|nr:hypothetical protein E3N88_46027 [Mikania micrantha]